MSASRMQCPGHLGFAAAAAVILLLALAALPAEAAPRKVSLEFACAKTPGGALRYVTSVADCRPKRERAVDIAADAPVFTCLRSPAAGSARISAQDRRGLLRRVARDGGCGGDRELVLPGAGARSFCVNRSTGALRSVRGGVPCHRGDEFKAIAAAKSPADLRVACARDAGGLLRFVETSTACRRGHEHVAHFGVNTPVQTCVIASGARRGLLRLASRATPCGQDRPLTLPGAADVTICVDRRHHWLRVAARCAPDDIRVLVPGIGLPIVGSPGHVPSPPGPPHRNSAPVLAGIEAATLGYDSGAGPVPVTSLLRVNDADGRLTGAAVALVSGYRRGHDTLSFTPASGITGRLVTGTGILVLSGAASPAAYQAALRSVRFTADAQTPSGTRTIVFGVTDGEAASNLAGRSIAVRHVNRAPNAADDVLTTTEDAPATIGVLGNDSDGDLDALTLTLDTTGTTGTVTLNPDRTVTYDPAGHFESLAAGQSGADSFTYTIDDGHGGTDSATVTVGIGGVNDAPQLGGIESAPLALDTGAAPQAITGTLTVADADTTIHSAQVWISAGHEMAHDTLAFTGSPQITGGYDALSGVLTLTGAAPAADYETALRSVAFAAGAPTQTGTRTITYQVDDGATLDHASGTITRSLALNHVNHAPTAADDAATVGEDGAIDVPVLANDSDVDADPLHVAGTTADTTVRYDAAGHHDALPAGGHATDTFTYQASDGGLTSAPATVTVTIDGANDAPTVAIGGGPTTFHENGDATPIAPDLTVGDVDTGDQMAGATVKLTGAGTADAIAEPAGAGSLSGVVDATGRTLTVTGAGTPAEYQAYLRGVTFVNPSDTPGGAARTATFTVADGDATNAPAAQEIDVVEEDDNPVVHLPAGRPSVIGGDELSLAGLLSISDPDTATQSVTVGPAPHGTLADGAGSAPSVTHSGTIAELNAWLDTLRYLSDAGFEGQDSLPISLSGGGGNLLIDVLHRNRAPVNTLPSTLTTDEDTRAIVLGHVSDPDAGSDPLRVTLDTEGGTLDLSGTSGLTFTRGDGTDDSGLTFTGTQAAIADAVGHMGYTPAHDATGADRLTMVTDDLGHAGGGGAQSDTDRMDIAISAVNDAPVNSVPGTQAVPEDQPLTLGPVSVSDVDAGSAALTETLSATHGTLTLGGTSGLTFTAGDGTDDATMTFSGSIAAINAALNDLTFTPETNFDGPAAITITSSDGGATGAGGAKSDTDTIPLELNPVNDPPVVATSQSTASYTENDPATNIAYGLTVTDADNDPIRSATVQITSGAAAGDELASTLSGFPGTYDPATHTLTILATDNTVNWTDALHGVTFLAAGDDPQGTRTISFSVNDGAASSVPVDKTITITAVDDPPVNHAPGAQTFVEGAESSFSPAVTISDPDARGDDVQVKLDVGAGELTVGGSTSGSRTLVGSLGEINTALATMTYTPAPGFTGSDTLSILTSDLGHNPGPATTDYDTVGISVRPLNGAPVNSLPATLTVTEDTPATLAGAGVSDPDAGTADLQVTLDATHGTVTLDGTTGLAFTRGDGTGDAGLTFTGAQADLDAALSGLTFTPDAGYTGGATLAMVTDDLGHTGAGPARSDTDSTVITIERANRAPVNHLPGDQSLDEDTPLTLAGAAAIAVADADAASAPLAVSLADAHGNLTLAGTAGLADVTGDGTGSVSFKGAADDVNAALDGLVLDPDANFHGDAPISITTDDQGATGAGGAKSDTDQLAVTVRPVNDAPVVGQPDATLSYTENDPATPVAPALTVEDVDAEPLHGATVRFTSGFAGLQDALVFTDTGPITGSYDSGTGVLTLSGDASVGAYQAALRGVAYRNSSDNPSAAGRTIGFQVDDGHLPLSNTAARGVTVTPVNDAPTADDETFNGAQRAIGNTSLVVNAPGDGAPDPAGPQKTISGDILDGDTDPDSGTLQVKFPTATTDDGGTVDLQPDGDFTYHPPAGCDGGTSDFFDYTVTDSDPTDPKTATGRVTIEVTGCVWYVDDSAAPGGDGRSDGPFDSLAPLNGGTDVDAPGEQLFVYDGTYGGGLALEDSQSLQSEKHGLIADGTQLEPADGAGSRLDGGLVLASGNTVQGLDLGAATGFALSGDSVGTAHVNDVTSGLVDNTTGGGVRIGGTGNALTMKFAKLSSNGGANGVSIANASGTFQAGSGGTIANAGTTDVSLSGGNLDLTLASAISDDSGQLVSITGQTGGTKAFSRQIDDLPADDDGGGISLTGNSASTTVNFTGQVALSTGPATALTVTGPGAVSLNDTSSSIATTSGTGVDISGAGAQSITVAADVQTASGRLASVKNRTGGTVTLSRPLHDTGTSQGILVQNNSGGAEVVFSGTTKEIDTTSGRGVDIDNNTGATVRFQNGGLDVASTTGRALRAAGGGSVEVSGGGNRLSSTTGGTLEVDHTSIADADLTFESIASNGASSGIALNTTANPNGRLVVSGTGSAGSGGTIQSSSGPGVALTSVPGGVSLSRMAISGGGDDGVQGTSVTDFSLDNSSVTNNGNALNESGLDFDGLTGTMSLSTDTVTGSAHNNVRVEDTSGTLTATVTGGSYGSTQPTFGADGIRFGSFGTATVKPTITGATFTNNRDDQIQFEGENSGSLRGTVSGANLSTNSASVLGGGITVNGGNTTNMVVSLTGNTITGAVARAITVDTAGSNVDPQSAQIDATISGNTIGATGVADSGSSQADGILISANGLGDIDALVENNTVQQYANLSALRLFQNDGDGSLDVTARGNTFGPRGSQGKNGILAVVGGADAQETGTACLSFGDPSVTGLKNLFTSASTGAVAQEDIRLRQRDRTTIRLPGYGGAANDNAAVVAFLQARNDRNAITPTASATNDTALGGGGFTGSASCTTPASP